MNLTNRISRQQLHLNIYVFGLGLMLCALPFSKFTMSIAQFILVGNWLAEGNVKDKFKLFFKNKLALVLFSLYLLHLVGLLWSCDIQYALKDLRIKLPLLVFPILFSSMPVIPFQWLRKLGLMFTFSVFCSTFISFLVYLDVLHRNITDIRDISIYISHIRLSLFMCLSIFYLIFDLIYFQKKMGLKGLSILLCFWFLFFINLLESATGISLAIIVSIVLLFRFISKINKTWQRIAIYFSIFILIAIPSILIYSQVRSFLKEKNSAKNIIYKCTADGNQYNQDFEDNSIENKTYINRNYYWPELREAWNKRSHLNFDGFDKKDQFLSYTILRFLSSKGLTKDRLAIESLNDKEIKAIENGITNYRYMYNSGICNRIHQIIWEVDSYISSGNPSGHSVTLKAEFWKTSLHIIKKNWLIGVGTGDIDKSFRRAYQERRSPLSIRYQLKSHNQYLRITVLFGVLGLIWFIFTLIYPFFYLKKIHYHYLIFFIIAAVSMISEDTLETQPGVTFFAFFNCFYLFLWKGQRQEL